MYKSNYKETLENIEGAIKNGKSRETGNIGSKDKEKQNKSTTQYVLDTTITQTNTNKVSKTLALLQTTREKD
jgi:hypothetical protein